jgi:hypothetical protein
MARRFKVGSTAECVCGASIVLQELPESFPRVGRFRDRRRFWSGPVVTESDNGSKGSVSHLCYPGAEGADGKALHEPYDESCVREPTDNEESDG